MKTQGSTGRVPTAAAEDIPQEAIPQRGPPRAGVEAMAPETRAGGSLQASPVKMEGVDGAGARAAAPRGPPGLTETARKEHVDAAAAKRPVEGVRAVAPARQAATETAPRRCPVLGDCPTYDATVYTTERYWFAGGRAGASNTPS